MCCENNLVLDFVDAIAVAALIMPCVDSWQEDLPVSSSHLLLECLLLIVGACCHLCVLKTVLLFLIF
mgnify:CR=1 FL=1